MAKLKTIHDLLPAGAVVLKRTSGNGCYHWAADGKGYREGRWSAGIYIRGQGRAVHYAEYGEHGIGDHSYTKDARQELAKIPEGSVVELLVDEIERLRARVQVTDDDIRAAELGDPDVCEDCPQLIAWAAAQPNVHLVTGENDAYQDGGGGGHVVHGFWSSDPRTDKDAAEIVLCSPMAHDWIINALAAHVGRAPLDVLAEIAATEVVS